MEKQKVAILGSGNIGTDLCLKLLSSETLDPVLMAGIDPDSDGLLRAKERGLEVTAEGLSGLVKSPLFASIVGVFDATSAKAHLEHAPVLASHGKIAIDLTPAAVGPYLVPSVNLETGLKEIRERGATNVNLVTCGGQATIPIVHAVARASARVPYAEIIASISSRSAGPGTRANIDEFTRTTSQGLEKVGGAENGKAIIVLNPAEPPLLMRDTVHCLAQGVDRAAIEASILEMVAAVAKYVPGYRLKQDVVFETLSGVRHPDGIDLEGLKVSVFLEVEGRGDWLPKYAGNLDIMTASAVQCGEQLLAAVRH